MARLASAEKLGYYKTPVSVVNQIKEATVIRPGVRLFDPCCGEGEALNIVASGVKFAETYGIELEKNRYQAASAVLDNVLHADAITEAKVSRGSMDLLFLNPPYDVDEGGQDQRKARLEIMFLNRYISCLATGGVLVLIVPEKILKSYLCTTALIRSMSSLDVYRFPDGEFEAYRQLVAIGRKGSPPEELYEIKSGIYVQEYPDTSNISPVEVSRKSRPEKPIFKAHHLDRDELIPLCNDLRASFFNECSPPVMGDLHPLVPMRQGHLAMLLAAGYINGVEVQDEGKRFVIKGTVQRVSHTETENTESHTVTKTTNKVEIRIRALDLDTGEIEVIQ